MTEREKIIKIIAPYVAAYGEDEAIADALIAAGIGDVGETKEKLKKINERILLGDIIACDLSAKCAEYKYRAEVAEHRAEVAEKALIYAVSEYRCDECPCIECNAEIRGSQECIELICAEYKKQAEREIEEKKGE